MNNTANAANVTQYKSAIEACLEHEPKLPFVLGETNSNSYNLNMSQIEGVFGSALWLIDHLLMGMATVSDSQDHKDPRLTFWRILPGITSSREPPLATAAGFLFLRMGVSLMSALRCTARSLLPMSSVTTQRSRSTPFPSYLGMYLHMASMSLVTWPSMC